MTEGIERTANKLIARSIYWTAVQFSGDVLEAKIILLDKMMKRGGAQGSCDG